MRNEGAFDVGELPKSNIGFSREVEMLIHYEGQEVGTRRADFLVEDKIMVEIKALINLDVVHLAQALNYLEGYNLEIGLLTNFGARSLEFKRLYNRRFKPQESVLRKGIGVIR